MDFCGHDVMGIGCGVCVWGGVGGVGRKAKSVGGRDAVGKRGEGSVKGED